MHNRKTVAIHQPNFFPWLGYFSKIARSDIFVFMDDVAYSSSIGGSYVNRVKLLIQGDPRWVGCPIRRSHGVQLIRNVLIHEGTEWREKMLRTLRCNYGKSPFYEAEIEWIAKLIKRPVLSLAEYNRSNLAEICAHLGISRSTISQSELQTNGASTELLVEITEKVGGSVYLCGAGAGSYQEDSLFGEKGIELSYQGFTQSPYPQQRATTFAPGLSILDAIFNVGTKRTRELLEIQ